MSTEARRDVFQAIADPTRRRIINLIAYQSMNLNAIADNFAISRPAVSQHIKILTECGMVVVRQEGRERFCEAKLDALKEVSNWVDQYRQFWNQQFDSLDSYLNRIQTNTNQTNNQSNS
jgi:DNA-binding transcriptional ArsR family regulator